MIELQFSSCGCLKNEYTVRIKDLQRGSTLFQIGWTDTPGAEDQATIRATIREALTQFDVTVPEQWTGEWWANAQA